MRLVAIVIAVSCVLFAQQAAACYQPAPQILFKPGEPAKTTGLLDALDGDASVEALRSSAEILHKYPSLRVYVSGFADSGECQGSQCDELAERRAEAVLAWLIDNGVAAERLVLGSFGSSRPLEIGSSPGNRRVELNALND